MTRKRAFGKVAALAAAGLLLVAACGDDGDGGAAAAPSDPAPGDRPDGDAGAALAAAEARVEELLRGTHTDPPADGPAAVPDKSLWVISCGETNESCADFSAGAVEAADALGWSTNLVDANFDPAAAGEAIRQAVADRADAIAWVAFDCDELQAPVAEARSAGIAIVGIFAMDCDDPALALGAEGTFVDFPNGADGEVFSEVIRRYGRDRADVVIAATGGDAKIVTSPIVVANADVVQYEGFEARMAECGGCEVVAKVDVGFEELGVPGALEQKMATALSQNPDADTVVLGSDSLLFAGIQQALATSGRAAELTVFGSEGYPSGLDLLRSGDVDSVLALDTRWMAWSAIDALNRHFAGAEPAFGGFGWTLVDGDRNLPAEGPWDSSVDFRAAFRQVWGR